MPMHGAWHLSGMQHMCLNPFCSLALQEESLPPQQGLSGSVLGRGPTLTLHSPPTSTVTLHPCPGSSWPEVLPDLSASSGSKVDPSLPEVPPQTAAGSLPSQPRCNPCCLEGVDHESTTALGACQPCQCCPRSEARVVESHMLERPQVQKHEAGEELGSEAGV